MPLVHDLDGTVSPEFLAHCRGALEANGFVVLKEASYRRAQERQRTAECKAEWEVERRETAEKWARESLTEERRLRDRCTYLYGLAAAFGAGVELLAGPG